MPHHHRFRARWWSDVPTVACCLCACPRKYGCCNRRRELKKEHFRANVVRRTRQAISLQRREQEKGAFSCQCGTTDGASPVPTEKRTGKRSIFVPTLYLTEEYSFVRRDSEDKLLVEIPARKGKDGSSPSPARKQHIPLVKVDEVVVLGEITMTASAIHLLLERNIEITYMNQFGQFKGRLSPPLSKNAILRMAQYRAHQDMSMRCELARRFVIGKLSNQRTMLQRYQRRQADAEMRQAIEQMAMLLHQLAVLPLEQAHVARRLASGDNRIAGTPLEAILGMEGAGSAAYFNCFGKLLSDPRQWPFPGRVKRPPTDPVNALLSFGYALLTNKVASAVQLVGFDHFVGYLHSSFYGRPSLALDLVEEFRPIIVDSVVLTMLNKRMLTLNDFVVELGAYRLKEEQRKVFFTHFEERINEEVSYPLFGYKATYRRCLELQARLIGKALTGEIDEYPPLLIK